MRPLGGEESDTPAIVVKAQSLAVQMAIEKRKQQKTEDSGPGAIISIGAAAYVKPKPHAMSFLDELKMKSKK